HAPVDEHGAARQRKRVDLPHVDARERVAEFRMTELRRDVLGKAAPDLAQIAVDHLVAHHRQFFFHLLRRLLTELHVLGRAVFVFRGDDRRLGGGRADKRGQRHRRDRGFDANSRHFQCSSYLGRSPAPQAFLPKPYQLASTMLRAVFVRFLACLLTAALAAAAPQPTGRTALRFGHAWDGTRLLDDVLIVIEGDKIVSVEPGRRDMPEGALDLRTYTAIPGLI